MYNTIRSSMVQYRRSQQSTPVHPIPHCRRIQISAALLLSLEFSFSLCQEWILVTPADTT